MYPRLDLYKRYKKHVKEVEFSSAIPDTTKKRTLELMEVAVKCAEDWKFAIDIGGGSGHYSIPLVEIFDSVLLIEPDVLPEHDILTKRFPSLVITHSFVEEATVTQTCDFVLLADIFEHIPKVQEFITTLSDLQDSGGVIYILTPNPLFCGPAIRSSISYTITGSHGHIRHYFKEEVIAILEAAGYYLVHHSYEESPARGRARDIIRGLSRRDKKWEKRLWYKPLRPLVLALLRYPLKALENRIYGSEIAHQRDSEHTMSSAFVFKKR